MGEVMETAIGLWILLVTLTLTNFFSNNGVEWVRNLEPDEPITMSKKTSKLGLFTSAILFGSTWKFAVVTWEPFHSLLNLLLVAITIILGIATVAAIVLFFITQDHYSKPRSGVHPEDVTP